MVSKQETFNTVVAHLRAQGKRAAFPLKHGGYACRYRGPGRTKCAVGCLIPESEYRPEFENGLTLEAIIPHCPALQEHNYHLMCKLQSIHDGSAVEAWERDLAALAKAEGLEYTSP